MTTHNDIPAGKLDMQYIRNYHVGDYHNWHHVWDYHADDIWEKFKEWEDDAVYGVKTEKFIKGIIKGDKLVESIQDCIIAAGELVAEDHDETDHDHDHMKEGCSGHGEDR
jgi:hypothetical protein